MIVFCLFSADRYRVIIKGEQEEKDYIHATFAHVR